MDVGLFVVVRSLALGKVGRGFLLTVKSLEAVENPLPGSEGNCGSSAKAPWAGFERSPVGSLAVAPAEV